VNDTIDKFICYTEDVSNVFRRHGVKFHLFADDKQVYVSGHVSDVTDDLNGNSCLTSLLTLQHGVHPDGSS